MLSPALAFIGFYQRFLSPLKGFRCAHAARHGGPSCSHAVAAIVRERGLIRGWGAVRVRFDECREAAVFLHARGQGRGRRACRPGRVGKAGREAACEIGECPCDACPNWP